MGGDEQHVSRSGLVRENLTQHVHRARKSSSLSSNQLTNEYMVSFLVVLFKTMDIAQAFGVCSLLSYMAPGYCAFTVLLTLVLFCATPGWPNERRADAPLLVEYFYKFGSVMLVPLCFMIIPNVVHNFLIFVSTSELEKEIWDDSKLFALWNPMVSAYISWFNSLLSFPFLQLLFALYVAIYLWFSTARLTAFRSCGGWSFPLTYKQHYVQYGMVLLQIVILGFASLKNLHDSHLHEEGRVYVDCSHETYIDTQQIGTSRKPLPGLLPQNNRTLLQFGDKPLNTESPTWMKPTPYALGVVERQGHDKSLWFAFYFTYQLQIDNWIRQRGYTPTKEADGNTKLVLLDKAQFLFQCGKNDIQAKCRHGVQIMRWKSKKHAKEATMMVLREALSYVWLYIGSGVDACVTKLTSDTGSFVGESAGNWFADLVENKNGKAATGDEPAVLSDACEVWGDNVPKKDFSPQVDFDENYQLQHLLVAMIALKVCGYVAVLCYTEYTVKDSKLVQFGYISTITCLAWVIFAPFACLIVVCMLAICIYNVRFTLHVFFYGTAILLSLYYIWYYIWKGFEIGIMVIRQGSANDQTSDNNGTKKKKKIKQEA